MNNSKVAAALIGGLAAGIGLGILFAPAKGSQTRNKLAQPFKSREEEMKARAARRTENLKKVKTKAENALKHKRSASNGIQHVPVQKASGPSDNGPNPAGSNQ